ncbi:MAG: hypothetical protein V4702_06025 [Patescibacteria group bacterium]
MFHIQSAMSITSFRLSIHHSIRTDTKGDKQLTALNKRHQNL